MVKERRQTDDNEIDKLFSIIMKPTPGVSETCHQYDDPITNLNQSGDKSVTTGFQDAVIAPTMESPSFKRTASELATAIIGCIVGAPTVAADLVSIVLGWDVTKTKLGVWFSHRRGS
ncbi:hypothetical protein PG997_006641 [Apiospora hydei]|uniref:Uncharacterized protein n=1 Tax=Apiospora hydei TaxID=1337664 RepID=A0ABR1WRP7_9PEZI